MSNRIYFYKAFLTDWLRNRVEGSSVHIPSDYIYCKYRRILRLENVRRIQGRAVFIYKSCPFHAEVINV